jgi:hypothetical protein
LGSKLTHLGSAWVALAFHAHTLLNYGGLINASGHLVSNHNVPYSESIGGWCYDNSHEGTWLSSRQEEPRLSRGDPLRNRVVAENYTSKEAGSVMCPQVSSKRHMA